MVAFQAAVVCTGDPHQTPWPTALWHTCYLQSVFTK
ncbi:MAG: hypothetical protein QOJ20_3736 [Mycobacterium sp.]|jgi:hypothetical protein|nr:hypothetical protein [Mycobacterium sp.]MDT5282541.1 hypothetical protein [Mycobacterium sp.]